MNNKNHELFESIISFRKGGNAVGVRAVIPNDAIPDQIKRYLSKSKRIKK